MKCFTEKRTILILLIGALLLYLHTWALEGEILSDSKEFITFVKTISLCQTLGDEPAGIAVDESHNRIYIANSASDTISVVDGGTNDIIGEIDISNWARQPIRIAMDADKAYIACLTPPGVLVLDVSTHQPTQIISLDQEPLEIASDLQRKRIYVLSQESLTILDIHNDTIIKKINVHPDAQDIAVNPNTGEVYIAGNGLTVLRPDGTLTQIIPQWPDVKFEGYVAVTVNPATNRVYYMADNIYVINGVEDRFLATVKLPSDLTDTPTDMTVNPLTNQIYISLEGHRSTWGWSGGYFIIDGKNNQLVDEPVILGGRFYRSIAVNPLTGFVYVQGPNGISVVKGIIGAVSWLPAKYEVTDLALNPITQKLYIIGSWAKPSFVIDLKSEKINYLEVDNLGNPNATEPTSIMINSVTNKVYIANEAGGGWTHAAGIVVIDGKKDEIDESLWQKGRIALGMGTEILAIDPKANQIYVDKGGEKAVIDAATGEVKALQGPIPSTAVRRPKTIQQLRSPVTHRVYKVDADGDAITIWDNEGKQKLGELKAGKSPLAIAYDQGTQHIYVVDSRGNLTVLKEEVASAQVKLASVQMPDSAQKGVPFKMTVSAQVTNADSPKGSVTISFSKPVEIQMTSSSASAKVYPQGSKLWNQQVKASIESKQAMVELWVEYWQKEKIHELSLDVTPLEAGDMEVFLRATATDAATGESVNAPKAGVLDQQGFPCEKRTVSIRAQQTSSAIYTKEKPPRFENFPTSEVFKGKPAPVNLSSHPSAPTFRTRLTEGAKEGPNFAGHYTIISWGCGTACQVVAVVDAKTGTVYFAPFTTSFGVEFRLNSNLFVADPPGEIEAAFGTPPHEVPSWVRSDYYQWENNQFVLVYSQDYSTSSKSESEHQIDWIKKLEDPNESIRQEAKKQILDKIWRESVRPFIENEEKEFSYGRDILLSDIDGNGTREIIASFSMNHFEGYIAVVDETLSTIQVIEVGNVPIVKTTDLFGEGKQALIIESGGGGRMEYTKWIDIYRWGQGKFTEVWHRDIYAGSIGGGGGCAKVQIVDLDQDGIREIVRIGYEWYKWEWEEEEIGQEKQAKVEIEIVGSLAEGMIYPDMVFGNVTSGYGYIFKEIYFWNKDFNRYIQYKARVTEDTKTKAIVDPEVDAGAVSIASGTVVGFLREDYGANSISVVLPDGRIVAVEKGVLERIRSKDERDR